jgi:nucleotide-binding universal stress UspA family protein
MHSMDTQLRLLLATDLSERSDRAFGRALRLTRENRAHLIILHVIDEALPRGITERLSKQALDFMREEVASARIGGQAKIEIRIVRGRDYKTIIDQARNGGVHWVILGTHREDALIDAFVGTTMARVLRYGAHPVLVVKNKPRRAYRNILVGTDFSDASRQAFGFALRVFPRASFTLLHVHRKPAAKSMRQRTVLLRLWERRRAALDKLAEAASERVREEAGVAGFTVLPVLEEGEPVSVITSRIQNKRTDLLVLGTQGRSRWKEAILGSVTQAMLAQSPCDVLAVRPARLGLIDGGDKLAEAGSRS